MLTFFLTLAYIFIFTMFLGCLGIISSYFGRRPTYRDVESWGWGKEGTDWEYGPDNRPRRIKK